MSRPFRQRPIHRPTTSRKGAKASSQSVIRHPDIALYRRLLHEQLPSFQRERVVAARTAGRQVLPLSDREVVQKVEQLLGRDADGRYGARLAELRAITSGEAARLALGFARAPGFHGQRSRFGSHY